MNGTRHDRQDGSLWEPGEYGLRALGLWYACSPNGHLANLALHNVVEHEDATITVEPSIGIVDPQHGEPNDPLHFLWHGFLERGVWRKV